MQLSSSNVKFWIKQKKTNIIASDVNVHCSKISADVFVQAWNHINAVEQTHHKSNSFEKRLTLLQAIKRFVDWSLINKWLITYQ